MNTVFGLTYLPLFHRSFMHTEAGLDAPPDAIRLLDVANQKVA